MIAGISEILNKNSRKTGGFWKHMWNQGYLIFCKSHMDQNKVLRHQLSVTSCSFSFFFCLTASKQRTMERENLHSALMVLGGNVVWRLFLLPEVARLSSCLVTLARKCLSPTWFHVEATVGHNFPKEDQCLIKDMGLAVFPLRWSQNLRLISPIWVHFGIRARSPLISVPQSFCLQSLWPLVNPRFSRSLGVSRCTVGAATACLWGYIKLQTQCQLCCCCFSSGRALFKSVVAFTK